MIYKKKYYQMIGLLVIENLSFLIARNAANGSFWFGISRFLFSPIFTELKIQKQQIERHKKGAIGMMDWKKLQINTYYMFI